MSEMNFRTVGELYDYLTWAPGRRASILSHRGSPLSGQAENCLATYEAALAAAPCWIEIDVRQSRDGVYMLNHDNTLDRCTTGTGKLEEHTFDELRALRLRDVDGRPTEHVIPTLDEVIELARGRTVMFVDVKNGSENFAPVLRYLREREAHLFSVTLTYDIADTLRVHRADPEACVYGRATDEAFCEEFLTSGIPHDRLVAWIHETSTAVFERLHNLGILATFGTFIEVDRRAEIEGLGLYHERLAAGADILNTDNVPLCAEGIATFVP